MKQIKFLFFLLLTIQQSFAQVVIEENPSYINSTEKPFLDSVLKIDVLDGTTLPEEISPSTQKLCFDKVFKITSNTPKGESSVCLFINTKIGLMAYTPIKFGSDPGICDIKPAAPDFSLNVISLKGNIYTYMNVKKPSGIEKWLMTGNSNTYLYNFASAQENQLIFKKDESREFLNGKVKAWAYKYENRDETWFLFGKNLPDKLIMQPLKYVGNFGVGYQYAEEGVFIILQVEGETLNSVVKEIKDTYICFDPSPYKKHEDEFFNKGLLAIEREKSKLDAAESRASSSPCAAQEQVKINFEKQALQIRLEDLTRSTQGNKYQNTTTQKAMANATINYNNQMQISIFDIQAKICRISEQISRMESGSSGYQKAIQRRECFKETLILQREALIQMRQLDRQYEREPGKAFAMKGQLMIRSMRSCN